MRYSESVTLGIFISTLCSILETNFYFCIPPPHYEIQIWIWSGSNEVSQISDQTKVYFKPWFNCKSSNQFSFFFGFVLKEKRKKSWSPNQHTIKNLMWCLNSAIWRTLILIYYALYFFIWNFEVSIPLPSIPFVEENIFSARITRNLEILDKFSVVRLIHFSG